MSFSSDVRLELARTPEDRFEGALAELSGFVLAEGALRFKGGGRYGLDLLSDQQAVIERYNAMLRRFLDASGEMRVRQTDRLGGRTHYAMSPDETSLPKVLEALHLLNPSLPFGMRMLPDETHFQSDHEQRALLRGAFLASGSVTNPERAYHLELAVGSEELAEDLQRRLIQFDLPARRSTRKSQFICYLKGAEHVSDALALLGASKAVMALENVRILKGVHNEVNRQMNCDQNNLDKVIAASEKQISMIQTIERKMGLTELPPALMDIALLRLEHPDATMTELGQMATPELGKSGVNARMRKLEAIAEELVNG